MSRGTLLQPGCFYHIYNRGNNRENLFIEERNYPYFLRLYGQYISPIADTYAYCLMRNHYHLLIRVKDRVQESDSGDQIAEQSDSSTLDLSNANRAFQLLFGTYAKAINKAYKRTGKLFEEHFDRIEVTNDRYFTNLIFYIHFNPQKHKFVDDFRDWPWSSYGAFISTGKTKLKRDDVLDWFGGTNRFKEFHKGEADEKMIGSLIGDDFD